MILMINIVIFLVLSTTAIAKGSQGAFAPPESPKKWDPLRMTPLKASPLGATKL